MDLVQLATGLTVLTAGLMVLCLLVAGLCACTSSRRKTVKHCETSQVEFEANAKHGLQPFQPILRQTVYREPNPSDTFPRPSDTFLRTSDTFLRPTDTFPRPFDTFPRPNPIGLIVEAPQIYPILEKITLSQQPANAYVESKPRTRFDSSCKLSSFVVTEGGKEAGGRGEELQGGDKVAGGGGQELQGGDKEEGGGGEELQGGDKVAGGGGEELQGGHKVGGEGSQGIRKADRKLEEQKSGPNNQPKGRLEVEETRTSKNDTKDPFVGQPRLFSDQYLPSNKDVFNHFRAVNISSKQRAETGKYKSTNRDSFLETAASGEAVWSKGPFPHISTEGVVKKIEKIHATNKSLHKHKNIMGERYRKREQEVEEENNKLFDISRKNWKQEIIKDRNDKKISDIDIEYLERCQRGEEVGAFGGGDLKYSKKIFVRQERKQRKRKDDKVDNTEQMEEAVAGSDSEDDATEDYHPSKKLKSVKESVKEARISCSLLRNISKIPELLAAADTCKLSNNDVARILAPIAKAAGLSEDDVVLSVNTVRRNRIEAREEGSKRVLEELAEMCKGEVVTLAWDEKQMDNEVKEGIDKKVEVKKRQEMLAIVVSCPKFPEGKTLAIVPMEEGKGRGRDIAERIWAEMGKASLQNIKIGGLCFDTTSKNSGVTNGDAKILQSVFLKQELLYLACRHHTFEIPLAAVWQLLMGFTKSSEDVFCNEVAAEFPNVDTEAEFSTLPPASSYPPAMEAMRRKVIRLLTALLTNPNSKEQIPRDDFREAFELALVMLGSPPPRWSERSRWRKCGNTSHAR